ncbi:MAG: response regulator transcription factor [Caldilineaceae bacterium]
MTSEQNPLHLLYIDDDAILGESLSRQLTRAGYTVHHFTTPEEGLQWLRTQHPDAILLDVDLQASRNGYDLCRLLRNGGWTGEYALRAADFADVPILMLTAKGQYDDQIAGFEAGSDEYMVKRDLYFSKHELDTRLLVARLRSLLQRGSTAQDAEPPAVLRIAALTVFPNERRVTAGAVELDLSSLEFDLLYWLARHPGIPQERSVLLREVWNYANGDETTRMVDRCIDRLRKKLEPTPAANLIQAKYGAGYFLANS